MTDNSNLVLEIDFVRGRRIELGLTYRDIAAELGLSEPGWARIEAGASRDTLTLAQTAALARQLAVGVTDLLNSTDARDDPPAPAPLEHRLGALLFVAGRTVPVGTLAAALEGTTDEVTASLHALNDRLEPTGLVVSVGKPGATLVPSRGSLSDGAVQPAEDRRPARRAARAQRPDAAPAVPRQATAADAQQGRELPARRAAARRLDRDRTGQCRWQERTTARPSRPVLVGADEGFVCEAATATVATRVKPKRLPWLRDDSEPDAEER